MKGTFGISFQPHRLHNRAGFCVTGPPLFSLYIYTHTHTHTHTHTLIHSLTHRAHTHTLWLDGSNLRLLWRQNWKIPHFVFWKKQLIWRSSGKNGLADNGISTAKLFYTKNILFYISETRLVRHCFLLHCIGIDQIRHLYWPRLRIKLLFLIKTRGILEDKIVETLCS